MRHTAERHSRGIRSQAGSNRGQQPTIPPFDRVVLSANDQVVDLHLGGEGRHRSEARRRPYRGDGRKGPWPSVDKSRDLPQCRTHASCARQGCSAPSTCAETRTHHVSPVAWRPASPIRLDGIIGRHMRSSVATTISTISTLEAVGSFGLRRFSQRPQAGQLSGQYPDCRCGVNHPRASEPMRRCCQVTLGKR